MVKLVTGERDAVVVFIAGYARCGSTLLERLLGQIEGFETFGELRHIWFRSFGENQLCGCGRPFRECPFWTAVVGIAFGGFQRLNFESIDRNKRGVDAFINIPRILTGGWPSSYRRRMARYLTQLERLYAAIQEVSGTRYLVDASKDPQHAYLLRAAHGLDVRMVHLIRDSRAVAYSWRRVRTRPEIFWERRLMPRYPAIRTALAWTGTNAGAEIAPRIGMPYVRVRYEDLVHDPRAQINRIVEVLGLDAPLGMEFLRPGAALLAPSHTVSGNPMRFTSGELPVRLDDEWQTRMTRLDWSTVTALTRQRLRRYGYSTNGTA